VEAEYRIRRPDGAVRWMLERGHVEFDQAGAAIARVGMVMDITEQRAEQEQVIQNGALLRTAGRIARLGGWTLQLSDRTLTWSDENCAIHDVAPGYRPTLEEGIGYFLPENRAEVVQYVDACERNGTPYDFELPKMTATGRRIWVRSIGEAVRDSEGKITHLQGAFQDITARRDVEAALLKTTADLVERTSALEQQAAVLIEQAALLDLAQDAIIVRNMENQIVFWNRGAEAMYGWQSEEALGRNKEQLLRTEFSEPIEYIEAKLLRQGQWDGEATHYKRDGTRLNIASRWTLQRSADGAPARVLTINNDVTERWAMALQMAHSAEHDFLTDLPNRMFLNDRINQAIAAAPLHMKKVAVLFLDLDGFKHINDSLGHAIGDKLLQSVAKRLVNCVRPTDTVSRQGGDEFVVLLSEVERPEDPAIAARRILQAVGVHYHLSERSPRHYQHWRL
jgi:diguanylate cyclase (GGDEF)-like protein/PAS domain S-box-containing protein